MTSLSGVARWLPGFDVIERNEAISAQPVIPNLCLSSPLFFCHPREGGDPEGWGGEIATPPLRLRLAMTAVV